MPFIKFIPESKEDRCNDREHNPPMHIVLPPGLHTYKCPSCGKETTFRVTRPVYKTDPNHIDTDMYWFNNRKRCNDYLRI